MPEFEKREYKKVDQTSPMQEYACVGEHVYQLTHPGTRRSSVMLQEMVNLKTGHLDMVKIIDYCLENIIEPMTHDERLKIDDIRPSEADEWSMILPSFLRGEGIPERFQYKELKKKG